MEKKEKKVKEKDAPKKRNYYGINALICVCLLMIGVLIGLVFADKGELKKCNDNIIHERCDCEIDCHYDVIGNVDDELISVEFNKDITKLTNLPDALFENSDIYVQQDGMHAFILDGVVYFEGYEYNDTAINNRTTLFRANTIKDPIKIRIFNETGISGASPAFHIITKDGKLYEIASFEMNKYFSINQLYSEYKIADITHKDTHGCDSEEDGHCGHVDLILQDGTKKVLWY